MLLGLSLVHSHLCHFKYCPNHEVVKLGPNFVLGAILVVCCHLTLACLPFVRVECMLAAFSHVLHLVQLTFLEGAFYQ